MLIGVRIRRGIELGGDTSVIIQARVTAAFILGLAVNALILSLAEDIITPIIGIFLPGFEDLQEFKLGVFRVGNFIAAFINFIIIALIIFIIVKYAGKIGIE